MYYENAFVAIFDILGFKNLIKQTGTIGLSKFFENFEKDVIVTSYNGFNKEGKLVENSSSVKYLIFSDTIVIYKKAETEEDFRAICDIAKNAFVFPASISLSFKDIHFPLRGAIGFGDLFISKLNNLCGSALVDAYRYSEIQTWAGCIATPNFIKYIRGKKYKLSDYFVEYDVPMHIKSFNFNNDNIIQSSYQYSSGTYFALNWTNKVCVDSGFIENLFDNSQDNHVNTIISNTKKFYEKQIIKK